MGLDQYSTCALRTFVMDHKTILNELTLFYEFCQKSEFTKENMMEIWSPLAPPPKTGLNYKYVKYAASCGILLVCILYYLMAHEIDHSTAIGRILLIKILPFWDWRYLFHRTCLIENPNYVNLDYQVKSSDCLSCESIDEVDLINGVSYEYVLNNYLNRDRPVIVTDGMEPWYTRIGIQNVTELFLNDDKLLNSLPCNLTTNLRLYSSDVLILLDHLNNEDPTSWFAHWQNCDIPAAKVFRKFYGKPYFISNSISPGHYNWVIMSKQYNSSHYKKIEFLDLELITIMQFKGSTEFKFIPHSRCTEICPEVKTTLSEGDVLVYINHLWNLEYKPGSTSENVALLTETVWN